MHPREYFDRLATRYSSVTSSGIGGVMKRRERNSIIRLLSPKKGDSILDAGCGSGFYARLISDLGAEVSCIDIAPKMVEVIAGVGFRAHVCDVESLRLERKFDKILCAGVLEFCKQPLRALMSLREHLRNGGHVVLTFPNVSILGLTYWLYHLTHGVTISLFTLSRVASLLESAGLRIQVIERPLPFLFVVKARPI